MVGGMATKKANFQNLFLRSHPPPPPPKLQYYYKGGSVNSGLTRRDRVKGIFSYHSEAKRNKFVPIGMLVTFEIFYEDAKLSRG